MRYNDAHIMSKECWQQHALKYFFLGSALVSEIGVVAQVGDGTEKHAKKYDQFGRNHGCAG